MATFVSNQTKTITDSNHDSGELSISYSVNKEMGNYLNLSNDTVLNDSDSTFLLADGPNNIRPTMASGSIETHDLEDHCHGPLPKDDPMARNQLVMVSLFCFLFMIAEIAGGLIANSLAIATDATHLACDLAGFLISLFAIWIAKKPPTRQYSFGYYRAEVLGALCSVLLIWVVTAVLVMLAIKRIVDNNYDVGGVPMIITASLGVFFNIIMGITLHSGLCSSCNKIKVNFGHGHSHGGHGHSHGGHGHSHGGHGHSHGHSLTHRVPINASSTDNILMYSDSSDDLIVNTDLPATSETHQYSKHVRNNDDCNHNSNNHHRHQHNAHDSERFQMSSNINVRAAFVHVIGDLIQSIGVFIAAIIIIAKPEYKIADPICTFIFSFLVLCTTVPVLKDVFNILMEGVPKSLDKKGMVSSLYSISGVKSVHCLNTWSVTVDKIAVNVHLAIENPNDWLRVLGESQKLLISKFEVHHPTIQVEKYIPNVMNHCARCQLP